MSNQIDDLKELIISILKRHDVKRASFFGSIVREELTEDSDLDILIEFEGEKSLLDLVGLKLELEEIVQRKVDLITYNSIHPLLKNQILSEQVKIL